MISNKALAACLCVILALEGDKVRRQRKRTLKFICVLTILVVLVSQLILVQQGTAQAPTEWSIIVDNSLNQGTVKGDVSNIQTGTDLVKADIVATNTKSLWWKLYVSTIGAVDIDTSNLFLDENGKYLLLPPRGNSATDALPALSPAVTFHQLGSAIFLFADRTTASGFEALSLQVADIALIALRGSGVPTSFVELTLETLQAPPFIQAALALGKDPPDLLGVVEAISKIASDSVALQQLHYLLLQLGVNVSIQQIVDALCVLRIFRILAVMYDIFTCPFADNVAFQAVEAENEPLIAVIQCNPTSGTAPLSVSFNASDSYAPQYPIESYEWNFGDGDAATGVAPAHTYVQPGKYKVTMTVTDSHGRKSTAIRSLTVSRQRIHVTGEAEMFRLSFEAEETALALSYSWDFGDGSTGEGRVVKHTYMIAGEYVVILTLGLDIGDLTQDWVPWVAWDTIKVTLRADSSPGGWSFSVDKYEDAPESVALNGIVVEDADEVWTNSLEHSSGLSDVAKEVSPRIVVEYADSTCEFSLEDSEALDQVADTVSPRIIIEYGDSIREFSLQTSEPLHQVADTVSPRIVVEYADSIFSTILERPSLPYDIAIIDITSSKTMIGQGYSIYIYATVENQGDYTETFNVTVYANTTEIGRAEVTLLTKRSTTIALTWDTTGVVKGNYTISAYATPLQGEIDKADNRYIDGWVVLTIAGDMDGDYDIDFDDIVQIAMAYGSTPGDSNWNPNADIDGDNDVDFDDVVTAAMNYGKSDC